MDQDSYLATMLLIVIEAMAEKEAMENKKIRRQQEQAQHEVASARNRYG